MHLSSSVADLLRLWADRTPDAVAIAAPGRPTLAFGRLLAHVTRVVDTLNVMGLGRNDRIAVVLPNGPDMAVASLAVAAGATCAPLNPAYGADEFDFYLSDLAARAVIAQTGVDSPARAVARARGIPIIELVPSPDGEAGAFALAGGDCRRASHEGFAPADDTALVLHTSGTTSRPKLVPLTGRNLCSSAENIRTALALTASDRCLNVMPLFHIHGLVGAVLASLAGGGSVVCTPGFFAPSFFPWLESSRPTWYTAVPTMHQAILARAEPHRELIARTPLRFIRSSSAALPAPVMAELERVFGAPVIEAYGMTEASHQMTSNPMPPRARKAGSVGVAAGPEVAIMDGAGALLPAGQVGEVVIRGANVTSGYEGNAAANAAAFTDGWFRTGDHGYLDADGYLFLTGRLKEIINRGGEKIAPREVDDVLLEHPAVAQAVTFAMPHRTLGEEVAAAVVLRERASVGEPELRAFASTRLAHFKVPRRVMVLPEIPKGPTGKLQRIGLAEKLGLTAAEQDQEHAAAPYVAPRTATEAVLATIWADVLGVERVGVHDHLVRLGGDSMLAAQLLARIDKALGSRLPLSVFLEGATLAYLAGVVEQSIPASAARSPLVAIQPRGSKRPFFCVHELFGDVLLYGDLSRHLGDDQPFFGFQARGLDGTEEPMTDIRAMATHYIQAMRAVQPAGPYALGGLCTGGVVAFEMAQQLHAQGDAVAVLTLLDAAANGAASHRAPRARVLRDFVRDVPHWLAGAMQLTAGQWRDLLRLKAGEAGGLAELSDLYRTVMDAHRRALRAYVPQVYPGRITLFRARMQPLFGSHDPDKGWRQLAAGGLDVKVVPGNHLGMLQEPHVRVLARELAACLRLWRAVPAPSRGGV